MDLWDDLKNTKSLYEIIRSVNSTKFDNIWNQNSCFNFKALEEDIPFDKMHKIFTSQIDEIHKELEELYFSKFNTSKEQLEEGIQKLNEIFTWGKNQNSEQLQQFQQMCHCWPTAFLDFHIIFNQALKGAKSSMKTISINVIIDTDVTINNASFHSRDTVYKINFMQQENKTLHISLINTTLERIYLSLQSNYMSVFVTDSIFIGSGIQMKSEFNVNHLPIVIDNCTFQGYISYYAVAVSNTTNVSVTNSRFQNLECAGPYVSAVICHDSQLDLKNVSVVGCACVSDTIVIHHSDITASYVRAKNNLNTYSDDYDASILLRTDNSILHIDNSTFEGNWNNILIGLDRSYVNINLCTFRNNHVEAAIRAQAISDSPGFTTIQNTIFADNTIRDSYEGLPGGIIYSSEDKVYLANVTLAHNHGIFVRFGWGVVEMMSCEFTNNTITGGTYVGCNVTVTNSVFQGNNGVVFQSLNSNLTVTKSNFSGNLNPDSGGIFSVRNTSYIVSPLSYIDISFCTFKGNYADNDGIIDVKSIESVLISNCTFYNNSANTGEIATVKNSTLIIKNSTVYCNSASGDGGTLSLSEQSILIIENSVFNNNRASGNAGVLLLTDHSTSLIENTIFTNNTCGIDGGVIKANRNSALNITNSSFVSNKALGSNGGAICIEDESSVVSEQCLFINNTAVVSGGIISGS